MEEKIPTERVKKTKKKRQLNKNTAREEWKARQQVSKAENGKRTKSQGEDVARRGRANEGCRRM